ncbi:MAG: circularly permuted type 2 ATP-grasp protein, partial [Alcanivoracaceae bacterium]|nr:circularly permuted type 2 ATP-grasp protein [Alcanivoracaceae bacterium]
MSLTGFDEMFRRDGAVRDHYRTYRDWLQAQAGADLERKRREAELLFHRVGITFNVYGEAQGTERLIPFDSVPRIIPAQEWARLEQGIRQRVQALNLFLHDIYHEQDIIRAGRMPAEQVFGNVHYQPCMQDIDLPNQVYAHISGVDLVRDDEGAWYVLEDNLRTPSGVSYMIENRRMMMRLFPELFSRHHVAPVDHYPSLLLETLQQSSLVSHPTVVLLTPGRFNSAYFEHAFLAQQMGIE